MNRQVGPAHWWWSLGLGLLCLIGNPVVHGQAPNQATTTSRPELPPSYSDDRSLKQDATLRSVAFVTSTLGVAVGDRGTILRTTDAGESWQVIESGLNCRLDDVLWIGSETVVAVGGGYDRITSISRGAVVYSLNAGRTWRRAQDSELPRLRQLQIRGTDRALLAIGDWDAASLSREFQSRDGGQTWRDGGEMDGPTELPAPTGINEFTGWRKLCGQSAPIRDACRIGKTNVFAVGDHGLVIRSRDGGKSWTAVRGANRRSGVLIVSRSPQSVAWPLVGQLALEKRNRVSVVSFDTETKKSLSGSTLELADQATVMLGGASADGCQSIAEMQQWISLHQPAALILDESLSSSQRSSAVSTAMQSGVKRIALYSLGGRGSSKLHSGAILPHSGIIGRDLWQDALHLVSPTKMSPESVSLKIVYDASGDSDPGDTVTSSVTFSPAQRLAAETEPATRRELQIVQARLNQPAQIQRLRANSRHPDEFAAGLNGLLDHTAETDRFRLIWSVLLQTANEIEHHQTALEILSARYSNRSAGKWAELRLQSMAHSLEWKRLADSLPARIARSDRSEPKQVESISVSPFQQDSSHVIQASATVPIRVAKPKQLRRTPKSNNATDVDLGWEFHPLVLVTRRASLQRGDDDQLQEPGQESGNLKRLIDDPRDHAWRRLLGNSSSHVVAKTTQNPPRLDGKLDDPCWQGALRSRVVRPLKVAFDDQYVYFALRFRGNTFAKDAMPSVKPAGRDHDLRRVDRFRLRIDIDQDLMTAMELSATDAGRTHDSIDSHPFWNPTWYVAIDRTTEWITFEMAVDRRDLVDLPIVAGQSWFISPQHLRGNSSVSTLMPDPTQWIRVDFR